MECPRCHAGIDAPPDAEAGTCPACGLAVRFLDVPEAPCPRCGDPVPLGPGDVAHCPSCRRPMATGERPLETWVRCPRCRRRLVVAPDDPEATCAHCGQRMALSDD